MSPKPEVYIRVDREFPSFIRCSFFFLSFFFFTSFPLFLNRALHSAVHLVTVIPLVNRIFLQFLSFNLALEAGVHFVLAR